MSSDYHLRCFPYAGVSFPSESPFFPVTFIDSNGDKKVRFNQGYVFDYQSYGQDNEVEGGGTEEGETPAGGVKKIKVSIEDSYPASGEFYVKILTSAKSAAISSAELIQGKRNSTRDFHYSADNLDALSVYTDGVGNFQIPACSFNSDGVLEDIYLRENIHWQKINFENLPMTEGEAAPANSFGVLYNWGEGTQFNNNPTVQFARIEQKKYDGEFPEGKEKIIKLERSTRNEGNIIITTQFPEILDDETSVLVRKKENEWQWLNPIKDYTQLLLYRSSTNALEFFDTEENGIFYTKDREPFMLPFPAFGSIETPSFLAYNGTDPFWIASDTCSGTESSGY